jgi:hypothetical protein
MQAVKDGIGSAKKWLGNFMFGTAVLVLVALLGLIVFRMGWVNWIDNYEIPYSFDSRTGKITRISHTGYVITPPLLVSVHSVDGRPMQVCISAIQRVLNCKLVEFDPKGLELFLQWHGRANYTNEGGTREQPTVFNQTLMAYAYDGSGNNYPFLHVIRELKPNEVQQNPIMVPR